MLLETICTGSMVRNFNTYSSLAFVLQQVTVTETDCIRQLLAGTWELDWNKLLQTPLSLTPEHLWKQLSSRSEFRESPSMLSEHDTTVVTMLSEMFQSATPTPLHQHL